MILTAQQRHYREKGWLVVEGVIDPARADAAAARAVRLERAANVRERSSSADRLNTPALCSESAILESPEMRRMIRPTGVLAAMVLTAAGCVAGGGRGAAGGGSAGPRIAEPRYESEAAQMPIEATAGAARPEPPAGLNAAEAAPTAGELERHRPATDR